MNPLLRSYVALAFISALATACHSAGPYGHSVHYSPLSSENDAAANSREFDPIMVRRFPDEWHRATVSMFGVVVSREVGPSGSALLTLSVRRLEPRNLCAEGTDEDSCRVTVSDKDFGSARVTVTLRADDDSGEHSIGTGSLVRVIGSLVDEAGGQDGSQLLKAKYYRHWPRNFYVTRKSANELRQ